MFRHRIEIDDRHGKPLVRWEGRAWTSRGAIRKAEAEQRRAEAVSRRGRKR